MALKSHRLPSPFFLPFPLLSLQLIIEGRIKKALCGPSFLGLCRAFKEKEGQGQLVVEHVYGGEMRKAKRTRERGTVKGEILGGKRPKKGGDG